MNQSPVVQQAAQPQPSQDEVPYPLAVWWRRLALALGCSLRQAHDALFEPLDLPYRRESVEFFSVHQQMRPILLQARPCVLNVPDGAPYFQARQEEERQARRAERNRLIDRLVENEFRKMSEALHSPAALAKLETVEQGEARLGLTETAAFALWPVLRTYTGPADAEPAIGTPAHAHQANAAQPTDAAEPYRLGTRKLTLSDEEVLQRIEAMTGPARGRIAALARQLDVHSSTVSKASARARAARTAAAAEAAASTATAGCHVQQVWGQPSRKPKG